MNLRVAMALSGNNKAEGLNDKGQKIIVQQRYSNADTASWLHIWHIVYGKVEREIDIDEGDINWLATEFKADPDDDCWLPK